MLYVQRNPKTNKTIVYSSTLTSEDYDINGSVFDKNSVVSVLKILVQRESLKFTTITTVLIITI